MGMPVPQPEITTIEELLALPEDGMRHELLDGEHVVTPSPRLTHQAVLSELHFRLRQSLDGHDDVQVFFSPADVVLGPQTLVQPDLFVVKKDPGTALEAWSDVGIPILAVEVLSPSTAARDRGKKRRIYQQAGVGEYWIVDADARIIERWLPADERPEIHEGSINLTLPNGSLIPFEVGDFLRALR